MSSPIAIASALRARDRFVLTSHARPDGDAVGSQLALAFALEALGKSVRLVNRDPVPAPYLEFPGTDRWRLATRADGDADAAVLLECSDMTRPDVQGLDAYFVVNIDHHVGNAMYGDVNWYDGTAAACTEMVADVIDALGVDWTPEIAAHLYLGIATDTGSFRHGPVSPRTFEICRRIAAAGVEPAKLARQIFDSFGLGRVKLTGALLNAMELHFGHRLALLEFDDDLLAACGASIDDTEGLVNLPLGAREVVAVALVKRQSPGVYRVSMRSKGDVDVRSVAAKWGGGGHTNAAGFTITGALAEVKAAIVSAVGELDAMRRPPRQ